MLETVNIRFCLVTIGTFLHQSWAQFCYQLRRVGPKLGYFSVLCICIFDSFVIFFYLTVYSYFTSFYVPCVRFYIINSTETVLFIFPFLQTNIIVLMMRPSGGFRTSILCGLQLALTCHIGNKSVNCLLICHKQNHCTNKVNDHPFTFNAKISNGNRFVTWSQYLTQKNWIVLLRPTLMHCTLLFSCITFFWTVDKFLVNWLICWCTESFKKQLANPDKLGKWALQ